MRLNILTLSFLVLSTFITPACIDDDSSKVDIDATVVARFELAKTSLVPHTSRALPTYTPAPTSAPIIKEVIKKVPVEKIVMRIVEIVVTATPTPIPTPIPSPTPVPHTQVGGLLKLDTTWKFSESPYFLSKTVQIPEVVTLSIEPGVEIFVPFDTTIHVHGSINIQGSDANPVYFHGVQADKGAGSLGGVLLYGAGARTKSVIDMKFTIVEGFYKFYEYGGNGRNTIIVHDSVFKDINSRSYLSENNTLITRSRFENAAGFGLGSDGLDTTYSFKDNCFVSKKITSHKIANPWFDIVYPRTQELTMIQNNTFLDTGKPAFRAGTAPTEHPSNIGSNYYGTTDSTVIEQMVLGRADDLSRGFDILLDRPLSENPIENCIFQ